MVVSGLPHHVTQHGNRREPIFFEDGDQEIYRDLLGEQMRKAVQSDRTYREPFCGYSGAGLCIELSDSPSCCYMEVSCVGSHGAQMLSCFVARDSRVSEIRASNSVGCKGFARVVKSCPASRAELSRSTVVA